MSKFFSVGLLVLFLFLSCGSPSGWAAQTDADILGFLEQEPVVTLSLAEAVLQALEHNLDITVSRQTRDVRVTDILFEQAKFDPTVELTGRYDRNIAPVNRPIFGFGGVAAGDEPDNFDQNDTNVKLGFSQKLLTGGDYDLTFDSNRNSVAGETSFLFNPSYTSSLLLNLTQPLLRDYGADVNRTQVNIARNSAQVEHYVFVEQVLEVVAQVEQAYWELVFSRENEKVFQSALKAAQELLAANQAKVQAGVLAEVEVLQAQAGVANRVGQVLVAQKAIRDQEDQLRRLISPSEEDLRENVVIIPLDPPVQDRDPTTMQKAVDLALRHRPEVLQAQKGIDSSNLNTKFAKNQMLPRLAFQGSVGLRGLGVDTEDSLDRTVSGDFYNVGAGLVLSYPLGNRSAQSQYRRRQLEETKAQASLQNVRRQVIVDAKEAVRRVQTDFKRMGTTRVARTVNEKQLKAEQERLNLGLSTTRQVLDFQRDLAIAQRNAFRAILDYNQSLSNLFRVTAVTLDRYQISLQ